MAVKRITIRVSPKLHEHAIRAAARRAVSLNELVVEALEASIQRHNAQVSALPLAELSALLAPAAEAQELSEEQLLDHLRHVRRQIWQQRYQQMVQSAQRQTS